MSDGLQFDRAEGMQPGQGAGICAACRKPLVGVYYLAQRVRVCEACRLGFEQALRSGSAIDRFLRATVFGLLAMAVGTIINYWAILKFRFGFISLLVGYLIGVSVRRGSGNRGGAGYQALAMILTYLSIVGIFVPGAIEAIRERAASLLHLARLLFVPFLAGKDSILLILLTGISLFVAWKLNRGLRVSFEGPFRIGGAPPETKPAG